MSSYFSQLDPDQQHLVNLALRLSRGDPRKVRKSLLEAMITESSIHNYNYGDRDSEGVLQQRPSTGWGPASESAKTDILQYLARARAAAPGFQGGAGALAQAIQGSAFPERYRQHAGEARALLQGAPVGPMVSAGGYGGPASYGSAGQKRAAVQGSNKQLALQLLGMTSSYAPSRDSSGLLMAAASAGAARQAPVTPYSPVGNYGAYGGTYPGGIEPILTRLAKRFGLDIGSGFRTKAQNDAAGGADNSFHMRGRAADVAPNEGRVQDFIRFAKNHPGKFMEFFYDPLGWYIKNGQIVQGAIGGHDDHIHYAI